MTLLIIYILVALGFSFLCSIAEAVLLSVTSTYIALMEKEDRPSAPVLRALKDDISKPLAAILTLNTIAHTVGAAGAGAQAAAVFGNAYVGVASAILTFMILVFSEIIPKTLGAHYWRSLAPATAYGLKFLTLALYPFVMLSKKITGGLTHEPTLSGFSREEFSVMADLGAREGQLAEQESEILKNLLLLSETRVRDVMTPRTVVFCLPESFRVDEFFHKHDHERFSRIPIYRGDRGHITGFVLRSDLLLAQARGNTDSTLDNYSREMAAVLESMSLSQAFKEFLRLRTQILLVVDEYGGMEGILTLEDVIETLLGLEIVDEGDSIVDMQRLARRIRDQRLKKMGLQTGKD